MYCIVLSYALSLFQILNSKQTIMKKLIFTIALLGSLMFIGIKEWKKDDISLKTKENQAELHISAKFPSDKTEKVQRYLKEEMNELSLASDNPEIDGDLKLNDGTQLYMRLKEGSVKIVLERRNNTVKSYLRIKRISKELGKLLTR
jgi:hypothetical protein